MGHGKKLTLLLLLTGLCFTSVAQTSLNDSIHLSATPVVVQPTPHSPTKATLLSLLPGLGQVYNHQAWKIPIVYGIIGGLGYLAYNNYTKMVTFRDEYLHRVNNGGDKILEGYTSYPDASIYSLYQSYNQRFQLFVILTAVAYGLNLVDAYVFGHLFDFQIDDDLSLHVAPEVLPQWLPYNTIGCVPSLSMTLSF